MSRLQVEGVDIYNPHGLSIWEDPHSGMTDYGIHIFYQPPKVMTGEYWWLGVFLFNINNHFNIRIILHYNGIDG